jgi:hypothetical protein
MMAIPGNRRDEPADRGVARSPDTVTTATSVVLRGEEFVERIAGDPTGSPRFHRLRPSRAYSVVVAGDRGDVRMPGRFPHGSPPPGTPTVSHPPRLPRPSPGAHRKRFGDSP